MHKQGPLFTCVWLRGESRDHFNHKGKTVLISSLQRFRHEWIMQQRCVDTCGWWLHEKTQHFQLSNHRLWNRQHDATVYREKSHKQFPRVVPLLSVVRWQSLTEPPAIKKISRKLRRRYRVRWKVTGIWEIWNYNRWHWCLLTLHCD